MSASSRCTVVSPGTAARHLHLRLGHLFARVNLSDPRGAAVVTTCPVRPARVMPGASLSDDSGALGCGLGAGTGSAVPGRGDHPPGLVFLASSAVQLDGQGGLAGGLSADPQCPSDLGVGGSLVSGCRGQQIDRVQDGVSGVSGVRQVLQGPLWAGQGSLQRTHRRGDPPPGVSALWCAHDNRSCHRRIWLRQGRRQLSLPLDYSPDNSANCCKQTDVELWGSGAPGAGRALISSYISRRALRKGLVTRASADMKDPREAATSGGQITKAVE